MKISPRYTAAALLSACIFIYSSSLTEAAVGISNKSKIKNTNTIYENIEKDYFQIELPSLKNACNSNYNVIFLEDNSFTVGDRIGLPKIYDDGAGRGRYGYISSDIIESPKYFKGIRAEIKRTESAYGNIFVAVQARDGFGNFTEWLEIEESRDNTIFFYTNFQLKYIRYRVRFVTGDLNDAPIVRSISIWGID